MNHLTGYAKRFLRYLLFAIFICGLFVAMYRWLEAPTRALEVSKPRILDKKAKELWITSDQRLLAIFEDGSRVQLKEWVMRDLKVVLQPLRPSIDLRLLAASPHDMPAEILYAFSQSGDIFAWEALGRLYISRFDSRGRLEAPISTNLRSKRVGSITFLGDNRIIIIFKDGKVESWDASGTKSEAGTWLNGGAWPVWPFGSRLVTASFPTGNIGIIEYPEPNHIDAIFYHIKAANGSAVAISKSNRILVGTASGRIIEIASNSDETSLDSINTNGRGIQSLAFFDDDTMLASGDLDGIYAKVGISRIEKLDFCPPAAKVRVKVGYLAFTTADDTEVSSLFTVSRLLRDRVFIFSTLLAVLSLIATLWPSIRSGWRNSIPSGSSPKP